MEYLVIRNILQFHMRLKMMLLGQHKLISSKLLDDLWYVVRNCHYQKESLELVKNRNLCLNYHSARI